MPDKISGIVTSVIDGDTFEVKVTSQSSSNDLTYGQTEKIRIQGIDAPELGSPGGQRSKAELERAIGGKKVTLKVYSRDSYGRLVCDVSVTG